jgi:hypothetical protein
VGGEGSGGRLRARDRGCRIVHISIQVYDGVRDENNSQCPEHTLLLVSAGVYSAIIVIDIAEIVRNGRSGTKNGLYSSFENLSFYDLAPTKCLPSSESSQASGQKGLRSMGSLSS